MKWPQSCVCVVPIATEIVSLFFDFDDI